MSRDSSFVDFIRRVRSGDQDAAAELVRQYEKEIRRVVRVRLTDPNLRRSFDSMDICQSVLANFFFRVYAGQFDLHKPKDLLNLLVEMARNKLLNYVVREHAQRRDCRRLDPDGAEKIEEVADRQADPRQTVAGKELIDKMLTLLSTEERYLVNQRRLGRNWAELSAELGDSPEALRKRLARALDRIARQSGLEDSSDA